MFKKRKNPNIRQRRLEEDEDETEDSNLSTETNNTLPEIKPPAAPLFKPQIPGPTRTMFEKKEKKKPKPEKKTTILSFEDELEADDGIVFQEKKSSLSYKLRKEMKKERKERKREMKETKDKNKNEHSTVSELDDLGIRIVNGREAEVISIQPGDSDSDETDVNNSKNHVFNPKTKREKNSLSKGSSLQPLKSVLQGGAIPDANLIHQIRKERQKAREQGQFIPLDDTVRADENKGRLIRDDDNDLSDPEDSKIQFSVNQDEIDRKQMREVFKAAQEEGSDREENEWEMQQLKKAGASGAKIKFDIVNNDGSHALPNSLHGTGTPGLMESQGMPNATAYTDSVCESVQAAPLEKLPNYEAESIIKRLKESRASLEEVYRRHQTEADTVIDDLVASKASIISCQSSQEPLTESFKFYQDLRGYVTDLRDCLNEKMPEIKRLEDQVYLIYRQKAQSLIQRRRQDVKDQNNEFSPFAGKAAKGDEYRVRRAAEREGRRTRRRRERERKLGAPLHHDGVSTDDEVSTSLKQTTDKELDSILAQVSNVFEDVEDEFSKLANVMRPFEEWKKSERASYVDAYVSHNLPKLFSAFIRLQLLLWNPLDRESDSPDMERMGWFNDLLLFGYNTSSGSPENGAAETPFAEDPDRRLITNIVEKVILVKIKELVKCFWDPLSHVQSVRLANLIRHWTDTYPSLSPSSKLLKEAMQAVIDRIRDVIDNDVFIPMFPKSVYESKTSKVSLFFHRQFWSAWKLFGGILMWHRIFSDRIIQDLAIRSLLNLYLLPALTLAADVCVDDAVTKARHVVNVLPREWCKGESGGTHPFLDRFENFFVTLATKLDPSTNSKEMKEIADLLKLIGSKQKSKLLVHKYL